MEESPPMCEPGVWLTAATVMVASYCFGTIRLMMATNTTRAVVKPAARHRLAQRTCITSLRLTCSRVTGMRVLTSTLDPPCDRGRSDGQVVRPPAPDAAQAEERDTDSAPPVFARQEEAGPTPHHGVVRRGNEADRGDRGELIAIPAAPDAVEPPHDAGPGAARAGVILLMLPVEHRRGAIKQPAQSPGAGEGIHHPVVIQHAIGESAVGGDEGT